MSKEIISHKHHWNKRLVRGVGINDADYPVYSEINGKRVAIPAYRAWENMLERCYSKRFHIKRPTYIGCRVCGEWLYFANFKQWHDDNYIENCQLDKDLLFQGNKIYSPDTCVYIPSALNNLLNDHAARRGKYPIGVNFRKCTRKYRAYCSNPVSAGGDGKKKHLGTFTDQEEAHKSYIKFKQIVIHKSAEYYLNRGEIDLRLFNALVDIG